MFLVNIQYACHQGGEDVPLRGGLHVLADHRGHRRGQAQGHHQLTQQVPGENITFTILPFVLVLKLK